MRTEEGTDGPGTHDGIIMECMSDFIIINIINLL